MSADTVNEEKRKSDEIEVVGGMRRTVMWIHIVVVGLGYLSCVRNNFVTCFVFVCALLAISNLLFINDKLREYGSVKRLSGMERDFAPSWRSGTWRFAAFFSAPYHVMEIYLDAVTGVILVACFVIPQDTCVGRMWLLTNTGFYLSALLGVRMLKEYKFGFIHEYLLAAKHYYD